MFHHGLRRPSNLPIHLLQTFVRTDLGLLPLPINGLPSRASSLRIHTSKDGTIPSLTMPPIILILHLFRTSWTVTVVSSMLPVKSNRDSRHLPMYIVLPMTPNGLTAHGVKSRCVGFSSVCSLRPDVLGIERSRERYQPIWPI